jgi:hypothetical protein
MLGLGLGLGLMEFFSSPRAKSEGRAVPPSLLEASSVYFHAVTLVTNYQHYHLS